MTRKDTAPAPSTEPLRILLVEDSEVDEVFILRELRQAGIVYASLRVQTEPELIHALDSFTPDIVLSDHSLPGFSGQGAVRAVARHRPDTPVIIVTGSLDEETAAEYIKTGAVDYVVKGRLQRLSPAVRRAMALKEATEDATLAEEALRETADHLRALIEASPLAIYSLTPDGKIRTWNAAAERIYGWPADAVIGQPLPTVPEDRKAEQRALGDRVLRGETLSGVETARRRRDGTPVQVSLSAGPLFDAAGRVTGIMVVSADVTGVRQLESQYRQAQKMEAVGRLAGGIAHDFNNVLTAIGGYSDLVLEDLAPEDPHRQDIVEIRKATDRAAGLTRQLLTFSRQQVVSPQLVDLNEVVVEMKGMLERLIGEDVTLRVVSGSDLGAVHADAGQIQQVVMNLAVNARDAMPEGGRLTISTANVELDASYAELHFAAAPGPYVMLAVSDTGTGMDEHTKAHLFEPFFTTKEKGKGTGLGLATVYGIVKQSGGYVWVYTERGQGTTFKVYLPRAAGTGVEKSVAPAEPATLRGSETILLAEDEPTVRTIVREALVRQGYTVLEAASPEAAIQIAEQHRGPIHLLLTDVVMPGQSGDHLAARLVGSRPEMRVLFMSGYPDDTAVQRNYLQKPFGPETLVRTVRQALDAP